MFDPAIEPLAALNDSVFGGVSIRVSRQGTSSGTNIGYMANGVVQNVSAVPLPASLWLLGTALLGYLGIGKRA